MQMSVCNRDIKLENTLLDTAEPGAKPLLKVCDFGYSINESLSSPKTAVGTHGYVGEWTARLLLEICGIKGQLATSRCRALLSTQE